MKSLKLRMLVSILLATLLFGGAVAAREAESGSGSGSSGSSGGSGSDDGGVSGRSSDSPRSSDDNGTHSGLEVEVEHGQVFLKPHGGDSSSVSSSISSSRSSSGMELEVEHGVAFLKPHGGATAADRALKNQVRGRILLQVQKNGEAWFVEPASNKVVSLGRPADALRAMREFGLGITNANLAQIPVAGTNNRGNAALVNRTAGRILLQVEDKGQAWYVDPVSHQRHSLGRPDDALRVMRNLGLGITDDNLARLSAL